jgi:hypothetical protein
MPNDGPWDRLESHNTEVYGVDLTDVALRVAAGPTVEVEGVWKGPEVPLHALRFAVIVEWALRKSGLLLHASAVAIENEGVVFVGPSGAGKSTAARFRPKGAKVLSDEVVSVFFANGQWQVAGTPLKGDLQPSSSSFPLRGIYWLNHGSRNCFSELQLGDAVSKVLSQTVNCFQSQNVVISILETASLLCQAIPTRVLSCLGDGSFWPALQEELKKESSNNAHRSI